MPSEPTPAGGLRFASTPARRAAVAFALGLGALLAGVAGTRLGLGPHALGPGYLHGSVLAAVVSPAFVLAAAIEIAGVAYLSGALGDRLLGPLLLLEIALLAAVPTLYPAGALASGAVVLGALLATGTFVAALRYLHRHKQLAPQYRRSLLSWPLAALFLGAGSAIWAIDGTAIALLVAVPAALAIGLFAGLAGVPDGSEERLPWLLDAFWSFRLLLFVFLAEFFLGALLDYEIAGPGFLQYIPFLPIPAVSVAAVVPALYDGLWFAAAILASAWFLILLGITMGTLLYLRIRETHEPALRYRMGLTIAMFGLAAVFLPSFASSTPIASIPALANLPLIGWGFGLRAGGPFESGVFLAVLLMYVFVGALTVLFGRKALCSVMCGAALLYQAAPMYDLRGSHQKTRFGRYFLGSQLSTAYTICAGLALVSLFAVSLLGVLHRLPAVPVANGELDTSALPLPVELYFGGLWFVMFVATPYIGTYNCASTGICHWGALSLPFARVGLYRLKVKDRTVCQACTTFDCAKACSVGLVDMPQHFRTTGEFRSTKCVGTGDCVAACPYGNLYEQDARTWVRRAFARLRPRPDDSPGLPLPMLPNRPASPPPAAAPAAGLVNGARPGTPALPR